MKIAKREEGVGVEEWCDPPDDVVVPDRYKNGARITVIFSGCFCESRIRSVRVGAHVEVIGEKSFSGCKLLTNFQFDPESRLKEIEAHAFSECESLQSFVCPRGVEVLSRECFSDCKTLSDFR